MTDEGAVCNRWVSVKKAYSIDNSSCEKNMRRRSFLGISSTSAQVSALESWSGGIRSGR